MGWFIYCRFHSHHQKQSEKLSITEAINNLTYNVNHNKPNKMKSNLDLTDLTLSAEFPPPAETTGAVSPSEHTRGRLTEVFIPGRGPPRLLLLLEEKLAFRSTGWASPGPWVWPWTVWLLTTIGLTVAVLVCRACFSSRLLAGRLSASLKKRS